MAENNNKPQVRVASIEVELGMSVQNKAGIWCKPTARMVLTVDGGTSPAQRAAIIKFPSPIGELHFSIPSPQPHVLSGTNRGIAGEK